MNGVVVFGKLLGQGARGGGRGGGGLQGNAFGGKKPHIPRELGDRSCCGLLSGVGRSTPKIKLVGQTYW